MKRVIRKSDFESDTYVVIDKKKGHPTPEIVCLVRGLIKCHLASATRADYERAHHLRQAKKCELISAKIERIEALRSRSNAGRH
jgi:uncharacterized protein YPO0396